MEKLDKKGLSLPVKFDFCELKKKQKESGRSYNRIRFVLTASGEEVQFELDSLSECKAQLDENMKEDYDVRRAFLDNENRFWHDPCYVDGSMVTGKSTNPAEVMIFSI